MPTILRRLALAVAALAVGSAVHAAEPTGRDLVIDAPGKPIRVRVVTLVDGKSIEGQLAALLARLIRPADANGDGRITPDEFDAARRAISTGYGPSGAAAPEQLPPAGLPIERLAESFATVAPPAMEIVVQPQPLVDRLELFAALDADHDGFISTSEVADSEQLFTRYDADGDGTLNQPELAPTEPLQPTPVRSGVDFPAGRFPFHWEPISGTADAVVEIKLIGRAFGRPKVLLSNTADGLAATVQTRKVSFDLAGIGLDLDATPARITSEDVKRFYLLQLRQRDADKNGYLNEAEFAGLGLPGLDFASADANSDGMLFPDELAGRLDSLITRESSRVRVEATFVREPLFTKLDTDGDGRLSRRELRHAGAALASADLDGDGQVGLAEFGGRYRLAFSVPNPLDTASPRMVADIESMSRAPSERSANGPAWFIAMDRNVDGDLERREFLGTAEQFAMFDHDGDGLISTDELQLQPVGSNEP